MNVNMRGDNPSPVGRDVMRKIRRAIDRSQEPAEWKAHATAAAEEKRARRREKRVRA